MFIFVVVAVRWGYMWARAINNFNCGMTTNPLKKTYRPMPEIFAKRDTCWNKFVHDKVCADVIQTNIHETIFHISPRRLSLTAGHGRAKRLQTPFKNPQQHRLYRRVHFFFIMTNSWFMATLSPLQSPQELLKIRSWLPLVDFKLEFIRSVNFQIMNAIC